MNRRFASTCLLFPAMCFSMLKVSKSLFALGKRVLLVTLLIIFLLPLSSVGAAQAVRNWTLLSKPKEQAAASSVTIAVDDFNPQPYQGNSVYYFNRLNGDRGALNNGILNWNHGSVKASVSAGNTWTGIWESLNHPIREGLPLTFSGILPPQIASAYQSQITGITVRVAGGTAGRPFRLELKDGNTLRWSSQTNLSGGAQVITNSLPALGSVNQLVLVLDNAVAGDFVTVEQISFTATTQITDSATKAFVWSYAMLLANWNPATGLIRDKAKDASGEMDAIQATGSLAAATVLAQQLGVITLSDATAIVSKISDTLLNKVPRRHGLWPHWVTVSNGTISILNGTEWSSVDTTIATLGLLDAQNALGLPTSGTEQMLKSIQWNQLQNGLSHGYDFNNTPIPSAWDSFGGESWLAELAYAASTSYVSHVAYASPPTANGSGFIDELAWLFVPAPSTRDYWGNNWNTYRANAATTQINYYPSHYSNSCFSQLGLFGLSAGEVSDPSLVTQANIYQAFGVGGQFSGPNDGSALLGAPVIVPHYSAMIASLRPTEVNKMWDWLINQGYFSPLNNVESLMFLPNSTCTPAAVRVNDLKGSWNLALQALGWGNYLVQIKGAFPSTWLAASQNSFLHSGDSLLTENRLPLGPGLDEDASSWGVYTEVQTPGTPAPTWGLNNISVPSLDGRALRCAITGGVKYSNVHCYRNLPADPSSNTFLMSMSFYYRPTSTFNNVGGSSIVQALEFTMNKWSQGLRYEWAVQWDNVDTGAPKWRYWNPNLTSKWVDLNISGSLAGEGWHKIQLEGDIVSGLVHYRRFVLDGGIHPLDISLAPAPAPGEPDKLAVAVQLDGDNWKNTGFLSPYEVFLDKATLAHVVNGTSIDSFIGNTLRSTSLLSTGESTRQSYEGLNNGPVKLASTNGTPIIGAERVIFKVNGVNTSFSEMMALPNNQLDKVYWLPWYNNVDLDTQLRMGNVSATNQTATVHLFIHGQEITSGCTPLNGPPYTLAAGASLRVSCAGVNNGPVKVESTQPIVAAERVIYTANGLKTSFTEMMALPNSQLNTTYWLPWYNNVDLDTQLRFGNVTTSQTAIVHVTIGGVEVTGCTPHASPFTLGPGESVRVSCAGINNGPVKIESTQPIVAAERVIYKVSNVPTSFTEMMALPNSQLNTTYWLPWYNNVDLDTQLRIGNISPSQQATVHLYMGGQEMLSGCTPLNGPPYTLAPGASLRVSCIGVNNGPVKIQSNIPIVAAERVIYKVNNVPTSFTEMMALPNSQLNTTYWLPWYNNLDLDTQLRFGVP